MVRVAPRTKNPSKSADGNTLQSIHQNHFAQSAVAGAGYRPNLFATDYFQQQAEQQPQTTRSHNDTLPGSSSGMNRMGSNAINFSAYQQPNYPQYAHTAPRNRSSCAPPRNANVPGAHKVINAQPGDKIDNGGGSFMPQCNNGKSLLPNPFLISRAASTVASGQSKGKLPISASSEGGDGTNKKFNSLKSSLAGLRKTPQFYYSMRLGGNNGTVGKEGQSKDKSCKRHQSLNQPKLWIYSTTN